MKHVVVLMDSEVRRSQFLNKLGRTTPLYLCRSLTPAEVDGLKIFDFEVFGLFTKDNKLDDFIGHVDGIIILVEHANVQHVLKRITEIIKISPDKPLLIVVETNNKNTNDEFKNICNVKNRKVFYVNYLDQWDNTLEPKEWFNTILLAENVKKVKISSKEVDDIINYTSSSIPMPIMASRFEDCVLEMKLWDHYGRLRIVHYSLMRYGYEDTIDQSGWLCTNWKKYKTSIGHGKLWHYTLTRLWTNIIYQLQKKYNYQTFSELYLNHEKLHSGKLYKEYYTDDVIFTDKAKNNWVPPNITSSHEQINPYA